MNTKEKAMVVLLDTGEKELDRYAQEGIDRAKAQEQEEIAKVRKFLDAVENTLPSVLQDHVQFDGWEKHYDSLLRYNASAIIRYPGFAPVYLRYFYYDDNLILREVFLVSCRVGRDDEVDAGKRYCVAHDYESVSSTFPIPHEPTYNYFAVVIAMAKHKGDNSEEIEKEVERRNQADLEKPVNTNAYVNKEPPLSARLTDDPNPNMKLLYALQDFVRQEFEIHKAVDQDK